jgi:hypothetical protein
MYETNTNNINNRNNNRHDAFNIDMSTPTAYNSDGGILDKKWKARWDMSHGKRIVMDSNPDPYTIDANGHRVYFTAEARRRAN